MFDHMNRCLERFEGVFEVDETSFFWLGNLIYRFGKTSFLFRRLALVG